MARSLSIRPVRLKPLPWARLSAVRFSGAFVGAAFAAASLAGCAPDLGAKPVVRPLASYADSRSLAAPATAWPSDDWWTGYGDATLDELERSALAGSPDLKAAAARMREAEAQAEVDRAASRPQLNVNASSQTTKESLNEGFPDSFKSFLPRGYHTQSSATLNLNWDLDFFGANRARLAAATSSAQASAADVAAARLQLSTAVAGAWAELARLYADRDAAADAVRIRARTFDLVGQRLRNGLETRGEYAQAQGGIPASQQQVDALDQAITAQRHAIAALLGEGPDAGMALPRPAPLAARPIGLPADVTVDLVGRRPDLAAARLRAEAAASRMKGARADFYPDITLSGDYGLSSLGIDKFTQTPDSVIGALGPALRLPIFTYGRLEGAYRGARAEYDAAVASYDQTLANALRDVADAISGVQSLQVQLTDARRALEAARVAHNVAILRYQGGLSPYLSVLTAETQLIDAERTLADLQGQAAGLDVTLVRDLGGGFRDARADRPSKTQQAALTAGAATPSAPTAASE